MNVPLQTVGRHVLLILRFYLGVELAGCGMGEDPKPRVSRAGGGHGQVSSGRAQNGPLRMV
jgi:hypothetical protein